jgi:hypothetical protein
LWCLGDSGLRSVPELDEAGRDDFELTRRAAYVLEQLRLAGGLDKAAGAVRAALLESGQAPPPPSTATLAGFNWPLVLTTNYDDLYIAAVHAEFLGTRIGERQRTGDEERKVPPVEVVGRSPSDCHLVLNALRRPARPLIWALQGFLPGQGRIVIPPAASHTTECWLDYISAGDDHLGFPNGKLEELERQLVVGHAEYRAVAMRSETFRRSFAEVCRGRSFLFLGSGLRDHYLLDLFSQIAELYGPSSQQHYAVVLRGEVDAAFLQRYFGIWVLEVDDYDELPGLLAEIGSPASVAAGAIRWDYVKQTSRRRQPSLSIVSRPLTAESAPSGCVVLSGGGSEDWPRLSAGMREFLVGSGFLPERFHDSRARDVGRLFRRLGDKDFIWVLREGVAQQAHNDHAALLVARVRVSPESSLGRQLRPLARAANQAGTGDNLGRLWRDLRLVKPAMHEVFDVAAAAGHSEIVSTLLASGSLRSFPPSFVLQEMARAWAADTQDAMSLEVRIMDETVLTDMRSGRLDLSHLLPRSSSATEAAPSMRFWLEIAEINGRTQRLLELREPKFPVREFLEAHWLGDPRWLIDVWPRPCLEWVPWTLQALEAWEREVDELMSLERLGVFHGSTLRVSEV